MNKTKTFSEYDIKYTQRLATRSNKTIKRYFTLGQQIQGINNLRETRNHQTIYISNHQSQLDGLLQGKLIFENRNHKDFAHILAATELDFFLFKMLGYNLSKLNFCWINRNKLNDPEYFKNWSKDIQDALKRKQSFLIYPEGTRNQNPKTAIEKIRNGFLREIINSETNPLIAPMAIGYDHAYEEPFYPLQNWGKKNFKPAYYFGIALPVLLHPISKKRHGRVYINITKPKRLNEILQDSPLKDLKDFLKENISQEYQKIKQTKQENARTN